MKRHWIYLPLLLCLLGLGLALHGGLDWAGASIPYPDPTPEMLAEQRDGLEAARIRACAGLGLFGAGVAVAVFRRLTGRGR